MKITCDTCGKGPFKNEHALSCHIAKAHSAKSGKRKYTKRKGLATSDTNPTEHPLIVQNRKLKEVILSLVRMVLE